MVKEGRGEFVSRYVQTYASYNDTALRFARNGFLDNLELI